MPVPKDDHPEAPAIAGVPSLARLVPLSTSIHPFLHGRSR